MMLSVIRNLGPEAPSAVRATPAAWRDPRLWIGVALVSASVLVGARVVGSAGETTEVWAARSDLAVGQPVTRADLVPASVHLDGARASTYLRATDDLPGDEVLSRAIGSGELVPAAAFEAAASDVLQVPVWAPAEAVPAGLTEGSIVDVWVTTGERADAASAVLDDVIVLGLPLSEGGLGPAGNRQVLVGVPEPQRGSVGQVLAAARDGRVALTREG
jgi:hypothetical protein